jgi:hypothetical protein
VEQGVKSIVTKPLPLIGLVIVIVGVTFLIWQRLPNGCANEIVGQSASPDGKWNAVVFDVDCGATTTNKELAPRVSILPANKPLSDRDSGNVFGAGNNGTVNNMIVRVSWTAANELTIRYPARASVFRQESVYKDVKIKYLADRLID